MQPALYVKLRVDNGSDEAMTVFNKTTCPESTDEGGYLAYSTILLEPIPAKSFDEGDLWMLLPGQTGSGEPAAACKTATLTLSTSTATDDAGTGAKWVIPAATLADVIAKVNK